MSASNILLDLVAVEMSIEKFPQRSRIQEGPCVAATKYCPKGEVHDPGKRIAGLGKGITAENIGRSQLRPELRKDFSGDGEVITTNRQSTSVDCSCGRTSYDREGIAVGLDAFHLTDALENAGLIGAASTTACHY